VTQRARYGWMALGGLLCLFGVVAAVKWRDGGRALAQSQNLPPISDVAPSDTPPPPVGADSANAVPTKKADGPPPPPATPPLGSESRPINIPTPSTPAPPPPAPGGVNTPSGTPLPPINPKTPDKPADTRPSDPLLATRPETAKDHPGEPPLAPTPGPVVTLRLTKSGETFRSLAKKPLNNQDRWNEIHKLNPTIKADAVLVAGTLVRLPADACVVDDEAIRPLPALRPRPAPRVKSVQPLTGTFPLTLDDNKGLTLPKAILAQLGNCDTVLLSPGSDKCLWLTNQAHLDRLAAKLDKSPARESDVRNFKRLYYAQTVKAPVTDGRVVLGEKLVQFAGLHQELVLVGIDDHFEVWDAARWRRYTQAKKATATED
jgi:MraZ protein